MHPQLILMYTFWLSTIIYAVVIWMLSLQVSWAEEIAKRSIAWFLIIVLLYRKFLFPYWNEKVTKTASKHPSSFFIFWFGLIQSSAIYILVCSLVSMFSEPRPIPHHSVLYPVILWALISTYMWIQALNNTASTLPDEMLFTQDNSIVVENNKKLFKALFIPSIVWIIWLVISLILIFK